MKPIILLVTFIITALATYYLTSVVAWTINDLSYKATLQSDAHIAGCFTIYWLIPTIVCITLDDIYD